MAKDNAIIINNFQAGIAPSSYLGFEEIRCLNTKDKPGVVYPNYSTYDANSTGDAISKEIMHIVNDGTNYFAADTDDNIFDNTGLTAWTKRAGNSGSGERGLIIWKGYLLAATNTQLDAMDVVANTWDNAFLDSGFTASGDVPMIVGQDDILYLGVGNNTSGFNITSITEDGTFDPATNTTWTENHSALDMPDGMVITCLAEFGRWLAIGTKKGDANIANVYLWDRTSSSFELPLQIGERGVNQMITVNNRLVIQAGDSGKFFVTDGTNVMPLANITESMLDDLTFSADRLDFSRSAIISSKNKVYTGFKPSGTNGIAPAGVYSIDVNTGELALEHITTEGDANTNRIGITALSDFTGDGMFIGWENLTPATDEFGINGVHSTTYTGDESFLVSQFYRVGTRISPKTFQSIEIELTRPMVSGDSVKIYSRTAQGAGWGTAIETWNTVGEQSLWTTFSPTVKDIQFKIVLNNTAEMLDCKIV